MPQLQKSPFTRVILCLSLGLLGVATAAAQVNIGALHLGAGTKWVSAPDTYVILDRMDLQYDADPILLNNVFRFTGTGINSIRGANQPLLYAIGVAKTDPGMLTLNQPATIAKRVNFETGYFDLNGNGLFLQPAALLTNESNNSRLVGNFGGYVTIDFDLPAAITANPGNLGAVITPTTDLGTITITRGHQVQYLDSVHNSIARWYTIAPPTGIPIGAGLRFTYFANEAEGFDPDSLVLWQNPNEAPWAEIGYTSRDASQHYVEKQGLNSLGRFCLGLPSNAVTTTPPPPPPTGASGPMFLAGAWLNDRASLDWNITAEYLDEHFDVERKYASESGFTLIAAVPTKAPGGTSTTTVAYSYIDSAVKTGAGDVYYRIHRFAAGGQTAYSNTVMLKARGDSTSEFIHKLYPTIAVGGRVYIEVGNKPLTKMAFFVVDAKGSIVLTGDLPYQSQWLPVHFLAKGVYRIVFLSDAEKWHATFIR